MPLYEPTIVNVIDLKSSLELSSIEPQPTPQYPPPLIYIYLLLTVCVYKNRYRKK